MRSKFAAIGILIAALSASSRAFGVPIYTIEQAVAIAQAHNPDIEIARKKIQGARGGWVEARSGYLPWLSSTGLVDKRQQQSQSELRQEDYNVILKLEQNLYTGGAVPSQVAIARSNIEKQNYELQEIASRVAMDVRIAFNELLLNRAKVGVRQNSVRVLEEDLKSQQTLYIAQRVLCRIGVRERMDQRPCATPENNSGGGLCAGGRDGDLFDGGAEFPVVAGRNFPPGGIVCGNRRGAGGFAGRGIDTEGAARNGVWDAGGGECGGRFCVERGSGILVGGGFGEGGVFVFGGIVFCWGIHDFAVEGERIRARGVLSLPASLQLA